MKYKVNIIGGSIGQRNDLAALLCRHSSFEVWHSEENLQENLCRSADFVFSLYAPDSKHWGSSIRLLTQRNVPVIASAGILKAVPVLSINIETGVCTKRNFKRHSYNRGFCIIGEAVSLSCEQLIALAETAVKQGYLMQRQAVFYQ